MKEITKEQFASEIKIFEGLCNKAQNDLQLIIDNSENLKLKEVLVKRYNDFEKLVNYVINETNYINAPASTKYHLCIKHGLLIHSLNVTKTLIKLNNSLNCNIPLYKLITVGLFHDLGKHDDYIMNEPTDKQKAAGYKANPPYLYNNENEYNEHESQSVYLISKYLQLDEDEFVAILYHNSPWDGVTKCVFKPSMLLNILQFSDYYSTLYLEDRL